MNTPEQAQENIPMNTWALENEERMFDLIKEANPDATIAMENFRRITAELVKDIATQEN